MKSFNFAKKIKIGSGFGILGDAQLYTKEHVKNPF
jgi:hypothetical protein